MSDKIYKKQLEKFGIESTVLVEGDLKQKRQIEFAQDNINIVRAIMDSIEGRQWLYSKLDMCRVFTAPFDGEKPLTNSFFSGMQAVGQNLLDDIIKSSPNNFFTMIQEADARRQALETKNPD